MTHDLTSRARQLLVDIGLKEPAWNPPPCHTEYETLVAFVANHLKEVAAIAELKGEIFGMEEGVLAFDSPHNRRVGEFVAQIDELRARLALLEPPK